MAGEAKITKKLIDEASDILKAVPEDKLDDVAAELGTEPGLVREFIKNPKSKQAKEFIKKAEGSLQGLVDKVLGRTAPEEVAPRLALPPAATPEQGLVPVAQPGRLQTVASKLGKADAIDVGFDPVTGAPMSVVGKKEPLALPAAGKTSMPSGRESLAEGMEKAALPKIPTGVEGLPSAKKVGAAAAGLGLGAAGAVLFGKGFSGEETAPPVVKEAGVDDVQDVKTVVDTIPETAVTPEQKESISKQVDDFTAAVQSFEQRMAKEQDEAKKEKELKEGRLEFMRALETIMHGVVSALGANAMLNRGSPFAIDFSKGPQTDWASEFNRLQKNYDSQLSGIRSRYGLAIKEQQEQRAAAQAESREAREEKRLELQERALEQRGELAQTAQAKKAETAAEQAQQKRDKQIADATGIIERISALDTAKDVNQLATARGQLYKVTKQLLSPEEMKQVEARAAELAKADESVVRNFFRNIGVVSQEKTKKEYGQLTNAFAQAVREKLYPEPGQAEAAPAPAPASDIEAKRKRMQELLEKQRGGQ